MKPKEGPPKESGIAQALAVADGDVDPHLARGLEQPEGDRIDRGDQQCARGMDLIRQGA